MKKVFPIIAAPIVLFALERVNLVKYVSFEVDNDVWLTRSEAAMLDSIVIETHDPSSSYIGAFSGSIDTRIRPSATRPNLFTEIGYIYQIMAFPKSLTDLDSLSFSHRVLFRDGSSKKTSTSYSILLKLYDPSDKTYIDVYYLWMAPDMTYSGDSPTQKAFVDTIPDQDVWQVCQSDPEYDLTQKKDYPQI